MFFFFSQIKKCLNVLSYFLLEKGNYLVPLANLKIVAESVSCEMFCNGTGSGVRGRIQVHTKEWGVKGNFNEGAGRIVVEVQNKVHTQENPKPGANLVMYG